MNDDKDIEHLLKSAGKRTMPANTTTEHIKQDTMAEWRKSVAKEKKRRFGLWLAPSIAASLAALLFFNTVIGPDSTTNPVQLVSSHGTCQHELASLANNTLHTSSNCSIVLKINENIVFVDQQTQLSIASNGELTLASGRVYVDSESDRESIIINTHFGQVTDIGTLFEVVLSNESLQVTLREGIVKVTLEDEELLAQANKDYGDQLIVDRQHQVIRNTVQTSANHWQWAQNIYPPFDLEGKTVAELVHWASRSSGIKINYLSTQAQRKAQSNTLSGGEVLAESISKTLPLYLKAAGFTVEETDAGLVIGDKP